VTIRCDAVSAGVPLESVQRTLQQRTTRFRAVYERALRENPTLRGTVSLRFSIAPSGRVLGDPDVTQAIPGSNVAAELGRVVRSMVLPSSDDTPVEVRVSLVLAPNG